MLHRSRRLRRGFSLVELLAVVLILAVLAAVAIPLYINTRRSSAARSCKGNIAMIAAAQSARALRQGAYADDGSTAGDAVLDLVGEPEGLSEDLRCPLDGTGVYTCTVAAGAVTIACPNAAAHATVVPGPGYTKTMAAPAAETIP